MELLVLMIAVFVSTYVGTSVGFGSAITLIPILLSFYPLPNVLVFAGIIHLLVDSWQILFFRTKVHTKLLFLFGIPSLVFGILGAKLLLVSDYSLIIKILGLMLMIYALIESSRFKFKMKKTNKNFAITGSLSGFVTGLVGIGGPLRSALIQSFELPKKEYLFTVGIVALFVDIGRISVYLSDGVDLTDQFLRLIIVSLPVSFVAAEIAKRTVDIIPQRFFYFSVNIFLFLAGVYLITK